MQVATTALPVGKVGSAYVALREARAARNSWYSWPRSRFASLPPDSRYCRIVRAG
jgi:hypothetical protein